MSFSESVGLEDTVAFSSGMTNLNTWGTGAVDMEGAAVPRLRPIFSPEIREACNRSGDTECLVLSQLHQTFFPGRRETCRSWETRSVDTQG